MIILSQQDPKWSAQKIGRTPFILGKLGCLITDISMLSDYFGGFKTPQELAQLLTFDAQARLVWGSMGKVLPFILEKRIYSRNNFEIEVSLKDPRKAVCLNVNSGAHWVVAVRKSMFPGHYVVYDPWTGKATTTKSFHDITGSAHFISK